MITYVVKCKNEHGDIVLIINANNPVEVTQVARIVGGLGEVDVTEVKPYQVGLVAAFDIK